MAVTFVNITPFFGSGFNSSHSFSHTVSGAAVDRLLLLKLVQFTGAIASATFNGVSLTFLDSQSAGPGFSDTVEMWYLINPPATTANVVINMGSSGPVLASAETFEDVKQAAPHFGTPVKLGNTTLAGTPPSISVNVSSGTGERVADVINYYASDYSAGGKATAGAGQTERNDDGQASATWIASSDEAGATTTTMSWTLPTSSGAVGMAILAVPIKESLSTTTTQTRDLRITGQNTNTTTRDIRIVGASVPNSVTRDLRITGESTDNTTRNIRLTGQATDSTTRNLRVTAENTTNTTRSIQTIGSATSTTTRDLRVTAQDTTAKTQEVRVTGQLTNNTTRDLRVFGLTGSTKTQDLRITGQDTTNKTQAFFLTSQNSTNTTRALRTVGYDLTETAREMYVFGMGQDSTTLATRITGLSEADATIRDIRLFAEGFTSATRPLAVAGIDTTNRTQPIRVNGYTPSSRTHQFHLIGAAQTSVIRSVKLQAQAQQTVTRSIKTQGQATTAGLQQIRIAGQLSQNTIRNIRVQGVSLPISTTRQFHLQGAASQTVNRDLRVVGRLSQSATRNMSVTGQFTTAATQQLRILGIIPQTRTQDFRIVAQTGSAIARALAVRGFTLGLDEVTRGLAVVGVEHFAPFTPTVAAYTKVRLPKVRSGMRTKPAYGRLRKEHTKSWVD